LKTFKQYLRETPDWIKIDGKDISWNANKKNIVFGTRLGILFYGFGGTHDELIEKINKGRVEEYETIPEDVVPKIRDLDLGFRMDFDSAGRVFVDHNVVTYWNEKESALKDFKLIEELLIQEGLDPKETKYQIISDDKFMSYHDFIGIEPEEPKLSPEEIARLQAQDHIASPMDKKAKPKALKPKPRPKSLNPGEKWWARYSESKGLDNYIQEALGK
jgi:hypothetical protein